MELWQAIGRPRFWILLGCMATMRTACAQVAGTVSMAQIAAKADLVVVATADGRPPFQEVTGRARNERRFNGFELNAPTTCSLTVVRVLKGDCGAMITVRLPAIDSYTYNFHPLEFARQSKMLLMLRRIGPSAYAPCDAWIPFVPLGESPAIPAEPVKSDRPDVVGITLQTFDSPDLRCPNAKLLSGVADARIAPVVSRYLEDTDGNAVDEYLECLGGNQCVSAIPRIVANMERALSERGLSGPTGALAAYRVPAAAPLLNPLLFHASPWIRSSASDALRKIADRSTIPFAIMGLRDPEWAVRINSYMLLHRLIPALGAPNVDKFNTNPAFVRHEAVRIADWWADELAGKNRATPVRQKKRK